MHAYGTKKCPVKQEGWCPKANSEHVIVDKWLSVHQVLQIPCMLETSSNDCLALSLMLTVNTLFCLSILHVPQRVDPHPSTSTPFTPPPCPFSPSLSHLSSMVMLRRLSRMCEWQHCTAYNTQHARSSLPGIAGKDENLC